MIAGKDLGITYSAFEHLSEMIIITDKNGNIEYVNPAVEETTLFNKDDLLGKNCRLFQSGLHNKSFYRQMWQTILQGETWKGEFCNKKQDGSFYWESATITPSVSDTGDITHFIAIKEDITDKKKRESLLKLQSQILNNISENVVITDQSGYIRYFNANTNIQTAASVTLDEGKHVSECFGDKLGDSGIPQSEIIANTNTEGFCSQNFSEYDENSGKRHYYNLRTWRVYDSFSDAFMLLGVTSDLTDLKEKEVSLSNHKKLFEQMLNSIDALIYVTEIDSYEIIYANSKVTSEFGNNIYGKKCYKVIQNNHQKPCEDCGARIYEGMNDIDGKRFCWNRKNSKNQKWYTLHGTFIQWFDGRLVRLIAGFDNTKLINTQAELNKSKKELDMFFNTSMDGFFFMMMDSPVEWNESVDKEKKLNYIFNNQKVTKLNEELAKQYNTTKEKLLGKTPKEFFYHDINYGRKIWQSFLDQGKLRILTNERTTDGKEIWIDGHYVCIYDDNGRFIGNFGVQRDVTKEKINEMKIKKSEEKFRDLAENINQIFCIFENWKLSYISPAFTTITGYDPGGLFENFFTFMKYVHKQDLKEVKSFIRNFHKKSNDTYSIKFRFISKDFKVKWCEAKSYFVSKEQQNANKIIILVQEITNEKNLMEKLTQANTDLLKTNKMLHHKSITDSLTEIYNHQHIIEMVNNEVKRSIRYDKDFSIVMMDIDFFKKINDTFGHSSGDYILKEIVNTIKKIIRDSDSIGRYGGEEFLLLLPETGQKDTTIVAEKIRKAVQDLRVLSENFKITLSLGIANFSKEYCGAKDLIDIADNNLYKAKLSGRNKVVG